MQGAQFLDAMGLELFKSSSWPDGFTDHNVLRGRGPAAGSVGGLQAPPPTSVVDDVIKEVRDQLKKAGPERKLIADRQSSRN